MTGKSFAKVNLALNVLNKAKPKELHDLDMINVSVSLFDTIKIDVLDDENDNINISCNNNKVPTDSSNFVAKVIQKYKKTFNFHFSCNVKIIKRIPLEAGLGGGSANAATTLNILDKLLKTNMTVLQKMKFLESITSDGPYMVVSKTSRVKGSGNQNIPLESKFKRKILLIKPKSGCNTKNIYSNLDYKNLRHPNINKIEESLKNNDFDLLSKHLDNSLIDSAKLSNPDIEDILNRLKACGFEIVSMTGSGSTCFAMSKNKRPFKIAKELFKKDNYELFDIFNIK